MVSRRTLVIGILVLLLVVSFPFWFTFFIAGPPTPLFSVSNYDNVSHTVGVEIIGPDNTSIFNDSRTLAPDEHWSHPKPQYMLPKSVFSWGEERCIVSATLDNTTTKNMTIYYHPWNNPHIKVYNGNIEVVWLTV
jgi:hypothetical protein